MIGTIVRSRSCSPIDTLTDLRLAVAARSTPYREGMALMTIFPDRQEVAMNAELITQAEDLRHVAQRLVRAGLIIDRTVLSPSHRRAAFALQCREASGTPEPERKRPLIGFPYPNAR